MSHISIPLSTYRLQFNQSFTFKDAANLVPYLSALGITHCYASPYLKATPGSPHGYDVVDPTVLNPELGTLEEYHSFVHTLEAHGMGHILDVVPNHMGIANSWNPWWQDVLENGPSSRYASFFDIDWHPVKPELENKVLLPILGDQYGVVLENQEIQLEYEEGQFFIRYYDHRLPIDPATWVFILSYRLEDLTAQCAQDDPSLLELQSIITAIVNLPGRNDLNPQRVAERYREKEVIKRRLAALSSESRHILEYIHQTLRLFNGTKGNSQSFDLLDALLRDQAYRLAFWQVAAEEINYRRFFDVNQLAAIRMENPQVFEAVHQLVFDLLRKGFVTGLRIDHVDGLHTPRDYLTQWQQWAQHELGIPPDAKGRSLFLVVEKILGRGESLCEDWPVHGTTGYDFLMLLNTLFVDPSHKREMDAIYTRFTKLATSFEQIVYESKKLIMASSMSSELNALGHQVNLLSEKNRWSRDFTLNSLTHAIREIIACFPVYRTYVSAHPDEVIPDRDRAYIRLAVMRAKRLNPATNSQVFDFIQHLLLKLPGEHPRLLWKDVAPFVMKFQQTTSPVTAKGVEDTAFYRYNRLISLNEVGGDPTQFGMSLQMFHERMRERQLHWPLTFSATSTHDTKRGEDVRARINVLSELPKEWKSCVSRWHRMNKKHKTMLDDQPVPDRNEEYFLYQTLIGAWPFEPLDPQSYTTFCERMHAYLHKALKEAKLHTSWVNPQEAYEQAAHRFLERILARPNPFLDDFLSFQEKIAQYGIYNALSQVVLKITAPGIPDFYQGTELWDLNLVDPDNRHPVDYTLRQTLLESLAPWESPKGPEFWKMLLESRRDGRIKLFITTRLLQFRKQQARLFHEGEYLPLETTGKNGHYLVAFQRRQAQQNALVIAPRFLTRVIPDPTILPVGETVWGDTRIELPQELQGVTFREVITDRLIEPLSNNQTPALSVARLFDHLPVAVLECRV